METNDLYSDEQFEPCLSIAPSDAAKRLYWVLHGSSGSVNVLNRQCNPDGPRETYADRHPIAHEPATAPQVAILTVGEDSLNYWQDEWWTINQEGYDEDVQPDPDEEPPLFKPLTIVASNGSFITINDYVSALHPWLIQRLDLILRAKFVWDDHYTRDHSASWLVGLGRPALVRVEEKDNWHEMFRRRYEQSKNGPSQG
ncbi:hypothetical protein B0I35DRAFT_410149 [Stachybotrys elegans]|uniref:Uncharacterized protein n=1 Tax=Stachybotrys elegans TaxID=80388 RepID=A0A8K0SQP4_9HYPO|nr:hypothetical protein B0I35DRAFT_410149 [Stachybotrys elegans]